MAKLAKSVTVLFGVVFVLVGVLGFVPAVNVAGPSGTNYTLLLGIFAINPVHNIIHLASGIAALLAGLYGSGAYSRLYLGVFGVVYALVTVLGIAGILFINGSLLGLVAINGADNILHALITVAVLGTFLVTAGAKEQVAATVR